MTRAPPSLKRSDRIFFRAPRNHRTWPFDSGAVSDRSRGLVTAYQAVTSVAKYDALVRRSQSTLWIPCDWVRVADGSEFPTTPSARLFRRRATSPGARSGNEGRRGRVLSSIASASRFWNRTTTSPSHWTMYSAIALVALIGRWRGCEHCAQRGAVRREISRAAAKARSKSRVATSSDAGDGGSLCVASQDTASLRLIGLSQLRQDPETPAELRCLSLRVQGYTPRYLPIHTPRARHARVP
jgi:hypothetical protein